MVFISFAINLAALTLNTYLLIHRGPSASALFLSIFNMAALVFLWPIVRRRLHNK